MARQTERKMSDVELAAQCAVYRTQSLLLKEMAKRINSELKVNGKSLLVIHEGQPYAVSGRFDLGDVPRFEELDVPEPGVCVDPASVGLDDPVDPEATFDPM